MDSPRSPRGETELPRTNSTSNGESSSVPAAATTPKVVYDEFNFPVEQRLLDSYQLFALKHEERRERLFRETWKDVKLTALTDRKKLKDLVHAGVPKEYRAQLWSVCSGALRMKESANANSEFGSYWSDLTDKLKKGKPTDVTDEIVKDIMRTFPGHPQIESEEGQTKLKNVLEAYAKRNKAIGYCQSMNFLAGISLIVNSMEEEEAFWLLASIVEVLCPGMWSKAMLSIQIDSAAFNELISEKLPELYKHMQANYVSTLVIATKWFMCLFVGALPTETCFRVWDYFFLHGVRILFIAGIAILTLLQEDLMKTKDTIKKSTALYDWKELIKVMTKLSDITDERIDELRTKCKGSLGQELTPETMESFRQQLSQSEATTGLLSSLSVTYQSVSGKLDSWYQRSRDNYNKFVSKRQVEKVKSAVVEMSTADEARLLECVSNHIKQPIDFIVQGVGTRFYANGKKYKGSFKNNKREGFGVLHDLGGRIEYNGYWKADKRDGSGTNVDATGNTYKGEWKADEYHGRGVLKLVDQNTQYDGEWKNSKMDGRGIMMFANGDWRGSKREGNGSYTWVASGNKYDGAWKGDKQEGKGAMLYANGDAYDGDWRDNLPNGRGVMMFANSEKYVGDWVSGKREGRGILYFTNGDQYDGEWKADKMNGTGVIIHPADGTRTEGQFKDGFRIEGGMRYYPNGDRVPDEPKESEQATDAKPSENYKETIMAKVKGGTTSSTRVESTSSLSSLSKRPNSSLSKAIEDIRKKNSNS